jgi:hypothetical protein
MIDTFLYRVLFKVKSIQKKKDIYLSFSYKTDEIFFEIYCYWNKKISDELKGIVFVPS